MNEAEAWPVLFCGQCNKPFNKQSTLKRHGYYCRSRRAGSTIRARSCMSCARAKVSCNNKRPQCSRCLGKGIACQYPAAKALGPGPVIQHNDGSSIGAEMRTPSSVGDTPGADNTQQVGSADSIIDGALVLLDPDFANLDVEQAGWDTPNLGFVADVGLGEFLNAQETNNPHFSPEASCFVNHSTPPAGQSSQKQPGPSPHLAIPASPSNSVRSLIQRPKQTAASQRITNLTLHTLKSYPLIMLRDKALPPFIHPSLLSSNLESDMEPLSNCISLMHMIGGQYSRFNKWELLAAMHALSIYILLRLDEGETEHDNFDSLIVRAVIVIAQKLCTGDITCHTQCALCNNGLEMSWKEWIFRESRRRLAVVYRVVNMLIYFEPAAMCDMPHEFILAPLPAKKQLWEASDEFTWKAESQREPGVQVSFGLASDGEVVQLGDDRLSCSDAWLSHQPSDGRPTLRSNARWEEWCSGIDGFGSLVMLAASLIV